MRVAITGGSGFIGTNLVDHYAALQVPLINLDPHPPRNSEHLSHWHKTDPLDATALDSILGDFSPTHVYHLGARTDLHGSTLADYAHNTEGVEVVLRSCGRLSNLQRVVFASSRMVCRTGYRPKSESDYCPPNPYGESKVRGEILVREANPSFPWVIVRPTSIWGPWFDVPYRTFFSTIAANRFVHVGRRPVRKSFGYVGNTVQQLVAIGDPTGPTLDGATVYLADSPIEVRDWANRIQREIGSRPIRTVPRAMIVPAAKAGDLLQRLGWSEPPLTSFRLENLLTEMIYDISPLTPLVPDPRYSLDEGIEKTVGWMREQSLVSSTARDS